MSNLEFRTMDCLDCHNRPSHNYKSPIKFFDEAMTAGKISKDLPDIKIAAMDVLRNEFPTKDSAFAAIDAAILEYYDMLYPELLETERESIDQALLAIKEGYSNNVFPYMKASWKAYPSHMGHMENNGCYRCHNDSFKNERQETISRDCTLCHLIKQQGPPDQMEYATGAEFLEFKHPVDINEKWKTLLCAECHSDLY